MTKHDEILDEVRQQLGRIRVHSSSAAVDDLAGQVDALLMKLSEAHAAGEQQASPVCIDGIRVRDDLPQTLALMAALLDVCEHFEKHRDVEPTAQRMATRWVYLFTQAKCNGDIERVDEGWREANIGVGLEWGDPR